MASRASADFSPKEAAVPFPLSLGKQQKHQRHHLLQAAKAEAGPTYPGHSLGGEASRPQFQSLSVPGCLRHGAGQRELGDVQEALWPPPHCSCHSLYLLNCGPFQQWPCKPPQPTWCLWPGGHPTALGMFVTIINTDMVCAHLQHFLSLTGVLWGQVP